MSSQLDTSSSLTNTRSRSKLCKTRNLYQELDLKSNSDLNCVVDTPHSTTSPFKKGAAPIQETLAQENLRLTRRIRELEDNMLRQNNAVSVLYSSNDTASKFALASEFKAQWEEFAREQIMDTFGEMFHLTPKIVN